MFSFARLADCKEVHARFLKTVYGEESEAAKVSQSKQPTPLPPPVDFSFRAWVMKAQNRAGHRKKLVPVKTVHAPRSLLPRERQLEIPSAAKISTNVTPTGSGSDFELLFRIMHPFTARKRAAADSVAGHLPYVNPRPYDHRGLKPSERVDQPEFSTYCRRDPGNVNLMKDAINQSKFHSPASLSLASGSTDSAFFLRSTPQPLECHLQQPTKWQPEAHLPRLPYPVRTGEYTRFRLPCRDPHEVFLAKVEEVLSEHNKKMRVYKERIHKVSPPANQNHWNEDVYN